MGTIAEWFKKLWDIEVKAYHSLKTAINEDKTHIPVLVPNPITGQDEPKTHLQLWFKTALVPIIIFAVVVLLVWSIFNKNRPGDKRKSHHGVNRYGERY